VEFINTNEKQRQMIKRCFEFFDKNSEY
jgi:hypothetical protein